MKTLINRFFIAITFTTLIFFSCSKSDDLYAPENSSSPEIKSAIIPHRYGVIPMTPDMLVNIPVYKKENFPPRSNLKAAHVSYTLAYPPVRDQGQIGSCTAFCGTEADEILYYYKKGSWTSTLSPAFVYYCERVLINKQAISTDGGAYMVNIPQALQRYGDCLEVSYLYPPSNTSTEYKTAPTAAAMTEALNYRIGQLTTSYAVLPQGDLDAVKNLLDNNIPVMLGFNVYDTRNYTLFEGLNTTNFTYNPLKTNGQVVPGAKLLGGHAVPIIGYDDNLNAFYCENSWGTGWGNKGFFYIPYSVYQSTKIVPRDNVFYATLN
jgi:hypothetical protein